MIQNVWDIAKRAGIKNFIALNVFIKKRRKSEI